MRRLVRLAGLLAVLLWAVSPARARSDGPSAPRPGTEARAAAQAELGILAGRIESLKREVAAGRSAGAELEALLARAQELASLLERLDRPGERPPARREVGPDPQELRERADALRDRADRLAAALAELDRRLAAARRRAKLEEHLEALAGPGDLFGDAAPLRAVTPRPAPVGAANAPGAPPGLPGPSPPPPVAPDVAPPQPSSVTRAAVDAQPENRGAGGPAAAADSVASLRRRRDELGAELRALRAQANALEAEAKAAEAAR